jgi:hypothetical protein
MMRALQMFPGHSYSSLKHRNKADPWRGNRLNRKIFQNRTEWYNVHGQIHNDNGPAISYNNGKQEWLVNGRHHRVDGPALSSPNGYCEWWLDGKRHRKDGPAIEWPNGDQQWYLNGELHRLDGPAIMIQSTRFYYIGGEGRPEEEFQA